MYDKGTDNGAASWGQYVRHAGERLSSRISHEEPPREFERSLGRIRQRQQAPLGQTPRRMVHVLEALRCCLT